jgi:hypothetical protein
LFLPVLLSKTPCAGNAVDVAFNDRYMAIAENEDGCELFELGPGAEPRPIAMIPGLALRVLISGDQLVIAGGPAGLVVAHVSGCAR